MADLGSKKISSNYQKLLQKNENGMVADGSGSLITLNLSGSEYYTSASANDMIKALTVTGSIIPEGSGVWDLGSEDSPFKEVFVTNESIVFINITDPVALGQKREKINLTRDDIFAWQTGQFEATRDATTKRRLTVKSPSTIRTAGVEPFVWDENDDLVSNDLTNLHIVSDKFWLWNSTDNELETRSIMFRYEAGNSPTNDLVIGG